MMGGMMLSLHNITYLNKLMREIRNSILEGSFTEYAEDFYKRTGDTYPRF